MRAGMHSQQQRVPCWVCFIMINLNPRRRQRLPLSCTEGTHSVTTTQVYVTHTSPPLIILRMSACVCSTDAAGWDKGILYGEGQNLARFLMEAPANHITPTAFANTIEEKLAPHAEFVTVEKRFVLDSSLFSSNLQFFGRAIHLSSLRFIIIPSFLSQSDKCLFLVMM